MGKYLVGSYTFTAASKTIAANAFSNIERLLIITNVTSNKIIYNFADPTKGGTLSGNTLTLTYDTTSMNNTDKLQIFIEEPLYITQFYSDSTYTYICKAVPGTALSSSNWQVKRLDSTGSKRYAGGASTFVNAATSLAVVGGYAYA